MLKKRILLLFCIILMLSFIGCKKAASNKKLGIRGSIVEISTNDNSKITGILVEGKIQQDTEYDKASIYVDEKTKIYEGETKKELGVSSLKKGIKVEVIFEGPVRESYPVQADAKIIRIIE